MCMGEPLPDPANSSPGSLRASAARSARFLAGTEGWTRATSGVVDSIATGLKSAMASALALFAGLRTWG